MKTKPENYFVRFNLLKFMKFRESILDYIYDLLLCNEVDDSLQDMFDEFFNESNNEKSLLETIWLESTSNEIRRL